MAEISIPLRDIDAATPAANVHGSSDDHETASPESSLPPVDNAWLFLAACWVVEAVTFGFGLSFGVFQDYYSHHAPFAGSGGIAAIGTTTLGLMYVGTPVVLFVCRLYPRQARWFTLLGLSLTALSLAATSFCKSVPQLIVTQGLLYGIGGCIAYCPCTLYIDEWFVRRKGFAYGVVWSAAGVGGVVFPLLIQSLLDRVGFELATRISAGILFVSSVPLSFLVKPRLPYAANTRSRPLNMSFATSKSFVFYQLSNVIEATGYFLPSIYLPTYAHENVRASAFLSTLTIILLNIATTVGLVIMGSLSDRLSPPTCMLISAAGATASTLLVWGFATSLPVLYLFCILYGLFARSWASIWPGIMRDVSNSVFADPVMVQGHLCVGRGLGNIVSGPLSGALLRGMPWRGKTTGGFGSGYGVLIAYTATTAFMSGSTFLLKTLKIL